MFERNMRLRSVEVPEREPERDGEVAKRNRPGKRTLVEDREEAMEAMEAGASRSSREEPPREPGRRTLSEALPPAVQRKAVAGPAPEPTQARRIAAGAITGAGAALPFLNTLQRAFGRHDLSGVRAHMGGDAELASRRLGARAFAAGEHVVLGEAPDLHTVAHEVAHVVQQRAGLQLTDGVGRDGDEHERQADAVADAVVAGRSAEAQLGGRAGDVARGDAQVQLRKVSRTEKFPTIIAGDEDEIRDGKGFIAFLQNQLGVPVTYVYDDATLAVVTQFQADHEMIVDGMVEATFWRAILQPPKSARSAPEQGALVKAGKGATSPRLRAMELVMSSLGPPARDSMLRSLSMLDQGQQRQLMAAVQSIDLGTLARAFLMMNESPQVFAPMVRQQVLEVGRPLALPAPQPAPPRAPAPRDPQFPVGGPGGVEHIRNSCYAASILTLVAAVPQYVRLFDPAQNPLAPGIGTQLQQAMSPLIRRVAQGQEVSGAQMAQLITALNGLNLLARQPTDPANVPTTALQHDAGEVLVSMLDLLVHAGNRGTFATRKHTRRAFDEGGIQTPPDQHLNVITLYPEPNQTLEGALVNHFANARSPDDAHRAFTDHHRATSFPDVLTLVVTRNNGRDTRVDAPQELTIPRQLTPDGRPGPRYRLQAFILRNNYERRGGHYVAYASDGGNGWYQADDLGGGAPQEQAAPTDKGASTDKATPAPAPSGKTPPKTPSAPESATPQSSSGGTKPEAPTQQPASVDLDAPASNRVEGRPLVQQVDLAEATYQDDETYPAFAMGCVYTYVLMRNGAEDDPRVAAGDLDDFPVYDFEEHQADPTYLGAATSLRCTEGSIRMLGLHKIYESELATLHVQLDTLALGTSVDPHAVEMLTAQIESLYETAWAAYEQQRKQKQPTGDELTDDPETPMPLDRAGFAIPLDRIAPLRDVPGIAEELGHVLELIDIYDHNLRIPEFTIKTMMGRFRAILTQIDKQRIINGMPTWLGAIDDPDARLAALTAIYQFVTTDLRAVQRAFAAWGRSLGGGGSSGGPLRVGAPGNRPDLHSQVVEELGPASNTKNTQAKVPVPYASYSGRAFKGVGPVAPRDHGTLLELSRDGGRFGEDLDEPNDKSVREGLTGLAAAKQHPDRFGNIVRGPKAIEFFDRQGLPWDVKTPPSRTRDPGLLNGTTNSIAGQLIESHWTLDKGREEMTGQKAPVSVLLDVTYLEDWDWINLWLDLATRFSAEQLARIHEIVVPTDPQRAPSQSGGTPRDDRPESGTPAKVSRWKQKTGPAKPRPTARGGKSAPKTEEPEDTASDAPKINVEAIYENVRFLESARAGGVSPGGSSRLPLPHVREGALDPRDVERAVTDVMFEHTNGTYSNHRGYLPSTGVLIEYHVSQTGFPSKAEARLVWNPSNLQLYVTGTHYECWYETWPGYAWRNGFFLVVLSEATVARIERARQAARTPRPSTASPASSTGGTPPSSSGGTPPDGSGDKPQS